MFRTNDFSIATRQILLGGSLLLLMSQAIPAYSNVTTNDSITIEEIEAALRKNPNDYRLRFSLARAYEQLGFHGLADEEDEFCEKQGEPFHAYILSVFKEKVRNTDYKNADMLYRYVEKHHPNDPAVLLTKALKFHAAQQYDLAEKTVRQLLESNTEYEPGTYTYLGQLLLQQKRYKDASESFDKELSQRPGFEGAIIGKAKALEGMKEYDKAYNMLLDVYRSNPMRPGIADTVANCLHAMHDYKNAIDPSLLAVAFATRPGDLQRAKNRIIDVWAHVDETTQRQALLEVGHVLDSLPPYRANAAHYHFAMGSVLKQIGSIPLSQDQFRRGLLLQPDHAKAFMHFGDMYLEGFGDETRYQKAKDFYEKGLSLANASRSDRSDDELRRTFAAKANRMDMRVRNRQQDFAWRLKNKLHLPLIEL